MKQDPNTILLVEDRAENAAMFIDFLNTQGYEVIHVTNGWEAWVEFLLNFEKICAVLCDYEILPSQIDSLELLGRIHRLLPMTLVIPISGEEEFNQKLLDAGASGPPVQKPFNPLALLEALPPVEAFAH